MCIPPTTATNVKTEKVCAIALSCASLYSPTYSSRRFFHQDAGCQMDREISFSLPKSPISLAGSGRFGTCFLFALFLSLTTSYAQNASTANGIEQFKLFLQSSPVISNIVFDRQVLVSPGIPALQRSATETQHFQGAWQSNAFFIRRLYNLQDVDSPIYATTSTAGLLFAGKVEDTLWHIVNTNVFSASQNDPGIISNYVAQISMNARELLSSTLNFGIEGMSPASLTWNGNKFAARSDVFGNMQGELEVAAGLPKRLIVQYEDHDFGYITEYAYSNDNRLPYGIPNQVHQVFVQGHKSVPQKSEMIFAVQVAKDDLPLAFFSPDRFILAEKEFLVHTNGATYIVRNGSLTTNKALYLPPQLSGWRDPRTVRRVILLLLGAATAVFLIFLFMANKKQTLLTSRKK